MSLSDARAYNKTHYKKKEECKTIKQLQNTKDKGCDTCYSASYMST